MTEILQSPLFWRRNWKLKLCKPRARLNEKKKKRKKNRQWDQKLKQDCENLDVLNYSKDSAYAISSLKNRRREIKISYQKASTLTVALIFEQALFSRFFFQALSFTKKCQLKQNNNSIPRMNLLSVRFVVVEPSWLFLVNHQKYRESGKQRNTKPCWGLNQNPANCDQCYVPHSCWSGPLYMLSIQFIS